MKPSELLTETQNKNFYETVKTDWGDGRERLIYRGHLLLFDTLCPSNKFVGLKGKDKGEHPRLQVIGSTRAYEQIQIRRAILTLDRLEEGLPCLKGFTVEMSNGPYDLRSEHLKYISKGEALVGPNKSVRRDSDKTFQEIMHRIAACKGGVCPDAYVKRLLMKDIERRAKNFVEKLSTPKKHRHIPKSPPAPPKSSMGGAS